MKRNSLRRLRSLPTPKPASAPLERQALTRAEAAHLLNISVVTLLRWEQDARRRPSGFFKTGPSRSSPVRYARRELQRWIDSRAAVAAITPPTDRVGAAQ